MCKIYTIFILEDKMKKDNSIYTPPKNKYMHGSNQ